MIHSIPSSLPPVPFLKMEGIGNDFVVVDLRKSTPPGWLDDAGIISYLCDRHLGIGADGVLAVLDARPGSGAAARMRVLNADGSEAEMCGNGIRCVAKYLYENDHQLAQETLGRAVSAGEAPALLLETRAGIRRCTLHLQAGTVPGRVAEVGVAMGRPRLTRAELPMDGIANEPCIDQPIPIDGVEVRISAISMGNPHAVLFAPAAASFAALHTLANRFGPRLENHPLFPQRTNVALARPLGPSAFEVVVWERGCGITQACGTGACATAVAACLVGLAAEERWLSITLPGGSLQVMVKADLSEVYLRGPARYVFRGGLSLG